MIYIDITVSTGLNKNNTLNLFSFSGTKSLVLRRTDKPDKITHCENIVQRSWHSRKLKMIYHPLYSMNNFVTNKSKLPQDGAQVFPYMSCVMWLSERVI